MRLSFVFFLLSVILPVCLVGATNNESATPAFGYTIEDKNNDGITDAFQQNASPSTDSLNMNNAIGPGGEERQREGHLNAHGEHGKQLDRGASPHAH